MGRASKKGCGTGHDKDDTIRQSMHKRLAVKPGRARPRRRCRPWQGGDHLTAHELTRQAHEHSMSAYKLAEELAAKKATSSESA
jgi:hypothetical protein